MSHGNICNRWWRTLQRAAVGFSPRSRRAEARRSTLKGAPLARRGFIAIATASLAAEKRIRVGCQTRAYGVPIREREKLLAVLDDLVAAGYEGFETNFASLEPSFENPAPMRAEFEKRGIALIGLHMSARFDPATLEKDRAQIERVAEATRALGGTHLMLSGPGVPRDAGGRLNKEALERRCAELNRAGRACRELGIRLASHNHARELENGAEELEAVLAATGAGEVSILLDVAYVYLARLEAPALIRKMGARIAGLHVRDRKGKEEMPMGAGEIDYRAVGEALRQTRWSGWVIFEVNRRADMSSRELVGRGRDYIRKVMGI